MDLIVREYNDEDFEEVNKLLYETFNYSKANIRNDMSHEFVGVYDSKIIGYFILNEMIDIVKQKEKFFFKCFINTFKFISLWFQLVCKYF